MTKAVEKPKDTEAILELEKQLADAHDLHRNGGGFTVSVIFIPDIKNPKEGHVTVKTGDGAMIDNFKVPFDKAWDAFHHPTQYSEKLLEYLGGKKKGK